MSELEQFRGVALVLQGDSVSFQIAAGLADEVGLACTPETRFQIASISKQFTAAAVLLLAERGRLSVDDPVARWVDRCPPSWSSTTLHHLLTHTAGLVHWHDLPEIDLTAHMDAEAELDIFRRTPLRDAPGASWSYSSPGYVLLAHIVQRAADRTHAGFLAEEVFGPLGMTRTFAGSRNCATGDAPLAAGHRSGSPVPSFELDVVNMGTGDVWSTARDLSLWVAALAGGALLTDASRRAMFAPHAAVPAAWPGIDSYGYGWFIGRLFGRRILAHPGDNAGFKALNAWFPDEELHVIALSNEETTDLQPLAAELLSSALDA